MVVDWHSIGSQLEFHCSHLVLPVDWHSIGIQLVDNWHSIGNQRLLQRDFVIQLDWHCIDLHLARIWIQFFLIGFSLPIEILFSIGIGLVMHCPQFVQHYHAGTLCQLNQCNANAPILHQLGKGPQYKTTALAEDWGLTDEKSGALYPNIYLNWHTLFCLVGLPI